MQESETIFLNFNYGNKFTDYSVYFFLRPAKSAFIYPENIRTCMIKYYTIVQVEEVNTWFYRPEKKKTNIDRDLRDHEINMLQLLYYFSTKIKTYY